MRRGVFRGGPEPAERIETVAEIAVPAGMVSEDEETFAVDCEPVLEPNFPSKILGGEVEGEDDDW
jgi:hypothetical protein